MNDFTSWQIACCNDSVTRYNSACMGCCANDELKRMRRKYISKVVVAFD